MNEFFVTFNKDNEQNPHPQLPEGYSRGYLIIEAQSWDHAREIALSRLGRTWSFIYPGHEFAKNKKYYPRGEIARWKSR